MSQGPDTKGRVPKTDIWPPPPNGPDLPPPSPRRLRGGLDALVTSSIGAACLLIVIFLYGVYGTPSETSRLVDIVIGCFTLGIFVFTTTGFIYGLMNRKTGFGRAGLAICFLVIAASVATFTIVSLRGREMESEDVLLLLAYFLR